MNAIMKQYLNCLLTLALSVGVYPAMALAVPGIVVKVPLYPVGSFEAKTAKVLGKGAKKGNKYVAKEIKVPVATLVTGISLRDKHLREKLKFKQYPHIIAKNIQAENGSGKATLVVMNSTKAVEFKYKDVGDGLAEATFQLHLPDFKINDVSYKGVGVEDTIEVIATIPYDKN